MVLDGPDNFKSGIKPYLFACLLFYIFCIPFRVLSQMYRNIIRKFCLVSISYFWHYFFQQGTQFCSIPTFIIFKYAIWLNSPIYSWFATSSWSFRDVLVNFCWRVTLQMVTFYNCHITLFFTFDLGVSYRNRYSEITFKSHQVMFGNAFMVS